MDKWLNVEGITFIFKCGYCNERKEYNIYDMIEVWSGIPHCSLCENEMYVENKAHYEGILYKIGK